MKLKKIAENHGLTPRGVDYALTQYQIVICEITRGMMSKLSYDAKDIIRMAQKRWCDVCELKEPVEPTWRQGLAFCGKCGRQFGHGFKYCPDCGTAVKWR